MLIVSLVNRKISWKNAIGVVVIVTVFYGYRPTELNAYFIVTFLATMVLSTIWLRRYSPSANAAADIDHEDSDTREGEWSTIAATRFARVPPRGLVACTSHP